MNYKRKGGGVKSVHPDNTPSNALIHNTLEGVYEDKAGQQRDIDFDGEEDENSPSPQKKMEIFDLKKNRLDEVISYTPPKLTTGKCWYISFYAFDPVQDKLRRKRIKLNRVERIAERRTYANQLMKRLNEKLMRGWNPWLEQRLTNAYTTFDDACATYYSYIGKLYEGGNIRKETFIGYESYLKNMLRYNRAQASPIHYIYLFNIDFCSAFLDHVWIERNNAAQTRDNYLTWLRNFGEFLVERRYIADNPASHIRTLGKAMHEKERTVIPPEFLAKIQRHLEATNKHYLLACNILYYCFIRPKEMSYIKLEHFSVAKGTLFVPGFTAKNKKNATVTVPNSVLMLMVDIGVFNNPGSYYLFSDNFMPGAQWRDEKQFRDYWHLRLRPALRIPDEYKFYSLKDTGITELIKDNTDLLTVRDQARHHSLTMTNIYTPQGVHEANEELRHKRGLL